MIEWCRAVKDGKWSSKRGLGNPRIQPSIALSRAYKRGPLEERSLENKSDKEFKRDAQEKRLEVVNTREMDALQCPSLEMTLVCIPVLTSFSNLQAEGGDGRQGACRLQGLMTIWGVQKDVLAFLAIPTTIWSILLRMSAPPPAAQLLIPNASRSPRCQFDRHYTVTGTADREADVD